MGALGKASRAAAPKPHMPVRQRHGERQALTNSRTPFDVFLSLKLSA